MIKAKRLRGKRDLEHRDDRLQALFGYPNAAHLSPFRPLRSSILFKLLTSIIFINSMLVTSTSSLSRYRCKSTGCIHTHADPLRLAFIG